MNMLLYARYDGHKKTAKEEIDDIKQMTETAIKLTKKIDEIMPDADSSTIERDDRTTLDKVIRSKFDQQPSRLIVPSGLDKDKLRLYTDGLLEASKPGWMYERADDREGKIFAKPMDFAVLGPNTLYQSGLDEATYTRNFDIGKAVYFEIDNHGRSTADELARHIQGINPELLFIIVNAMIAQDFLTLYREVDGTETLELVDSKDRDRRRQIAINRGLDSLREVDEENRYFLNQLPNYSSMDDLN